MLLPPPAAPTPTLSPILDDASIEDLLQIDGVELMAKKGSDMLEAPHVPENDEIIREVLMISTENRRLRQEAEVCR